MRLEASLRETDAGERELERLGVLVFAGTLFALLRFGVAFLAGAACLPTLRFGAFFFAGILCLFL